MRNKEVVGKRREGLVVEVGRGEGSSMMEYSVLERRLF